MSFSFQRSLARTGAQPSTHRRGNQWNPKTNNMRLRFPYKVGYDVAGTIAEVGTSVTSFGVGDKVYSRVPNNLRGSVAEYVLSVESATALMPLETNFTQAASIPLAGLTALQSMEKADAMLEGG